MSLSKFDQWLQEPYYADDGGDLIANRAEEILKEVKPETLSSLMEALNEDILYSQESEINEMLRTKNFEALGRKIWSMNWDYWEQWAENVATEEYNRGNLE